MTDTLQQGFAFPSGSPALPVAASPAEALAAWVPEETFRQVLTLDGGKQLGLSSLETADAVRIRLVSNAGPGLLLHWGLAWRFRHEWQLPPEGFRPTGTTLPDNQAARTPFASAGGLQFLEMTFRKPAEGKPPVGLRFVLHQPPHNWLKCGGKELFVPLFASARDPRLSSAQLQDLAEQIVAPETTALSWTLMHRFNLCHDLLAGVQEDEDALALLFAWLRYSATRQLDWQRRYNTKPRELSHSQDRLTARLAGLYRRRSNWAAGRVWVRLMLTTLGRGGDGQRVRDEILHIMHRNDLKECAGNFIEEWHQKLHNNTTPDDVVICEAYLAYLRGNGDLGAFHRTLEANGVTRERLRSFERPIRADPVFYADRKDRLIGEFENFLRILKSVHAGTDLETAVNAARGRLGQGLQQKLDWILGSRHGARVEDLLAAATQAREWLREAMNSTGDDPGLRDLLYLDLALEDFARSLVERQNVSQMGSDALFEFSLLALRNLSLSVESQELNACLGHWAALAGVPRQQREGRDWALHAKSVADRVARWVAGATSEIYQRLQPKADFLGEAFGATPWARELFSEEVIRGGPAFALSALLRHLDPALRKSAGLGGWQVISPARAAGRVRVTDRLLAVQSERFAEPAVVVADAVGGDEEIPEGVKAVITRDTPDLVSHLAVRARNAGVLFATCYDGEVYARLQGLQGKLAALRVTPGGDVEFSETDSLDKSELPAKEASQFALPSHEAANTPNLVLTQDQFAPGLVGGKSNNLNGLRGKLPEWIRLPASLALPFGTFERVLDEEANAGLRGEYQALLGKAEQAPAVLGQVRALLPRLIIPDRLKSALLDAWQKAGLPAVPGEQAWNAVTRVWASKWNERAYLSRRARGVPHDALRMAVLVQQVVEADYAFVIHTANPLTGNREELYAEVVLGLGETLVGNYPGRALGFVCRKSDLRIELLSYPGKTEGLYGRGVIFRSDSNGEDLEDFAGAGLYDSFLAQEPEHRVLDYRSEKLVWDGRFREDLLRGIARVGLEVERVLGSAQDIEGAVAGGQFYVVQTRPQVGLSG